MDFLRHLTVSLSDSASPASLPCQCLGHDEEWAAFCHWGRRFHMLCWTIPQMLLWRLTGDFHKALHCLTVQSVVSRHSQGYAQTLGKDLCPHWEFSEELMMGNYIWRGGTPVWLGMVEELGECWAGYKGSSGRAQPDTCYTRLPLLLAWSLPFWSTREQAANTIKDTYQLTETMHRSLHSKHAAEVLNHCRC